MTTQIDNVTNDLAMVATDVKATFGSLTVDQLNWKPNESSWGVGQCLEHLIITNKLEFPAIEDAQSAGYKNPFWSRVPFLSGFFGKTVIYFSRPENARKFKAPKNFQPSKSQVSESIVKDFVEHQQELINVFERSINLDLKKTKIVSPIGKFITHSLDDAFTLLVVHEQRHINQAKRVTEAAGFPK